MNIGYARVSTEEQNLDLQIGALEAAGCDTIYEDRGISGAAAYRPGLADALARAGEGDVLVVWKLDRLGRPCPIWSRSSMVCAKPGSDCDRGSAPSPPSDSSPSRALSR